jgi:predicted RNA binding protein YcfA (HicA-like mRNA interferase family)
VSPRAIPPLPARRVIKALQKLGFEVVGQRGSHVKLRHDDGRMVVVPDHGGRDLRFGTLMKIITEDAELTVDQFKDAL